MRKRWLVNRLGDQAAGDVCADVVRMLQSDGETEDAISDQSTEACFGVLRVAIGGFKNVICANPVDKAAEVPEGYCEVNMP